MRRFFLRDIGGRIEVEGELARRIKKVLRMKQGDELVLFDGTGFEYRAIIEEIREGVILRVVEKYKAEEPEFEIYLFPSLIKRFELVLEKGTELGVFSFIPVISERSVVRGAGGEKLRRWERIIIEACEQCGRSKLPSISEPKNLKEAVSEASGFSIYLKKGGFKAWDVLKRYDGGRINIFVGPEGDFSEREISIFDKAGFIPVSLGGYTLRAETASIAFLSILREKLGF